MEDPRGRVKNPLREDTEAQSSAAARLPARKPLWELEATWDFESSEDVGPSAHDEPLRGDRYGERSDRSRGVPYNERRDALRGDPHNERPGRLPGDVEDERRLPLAGDPHGRTATRPAEIPTRGWRDIVARVWQNLGRDNTSLVSAGIGLHTLLAVFPALAVVVSVYGMFASAADVSRDLLPFLGVLPGDAAKLITDQLESLTTPQNHALGFGAIAATLLALWNSRQGMVSLMTATNIAYNERERRSLLRQVAVSIVFSLGAMLIFLVMLLVGVAVPLLLRVAPLGRGATIALLVSRWVVLWTFAVLGFSIAYRYAPDRQRAQWRWVTWGSVVAATVWLLGSLAFSAYVQNFGSYGKTYGALGGVIVLITWFYLMGFTIVLGAEINAEMEHQTAVDTTEGPPAPMGKRGAYVADTLGRTTK